MVKKKLINMHVIKLKYWGPAPEFRMECEKKYNKENWVDCDKFDLILS